MKKHPKRAHSPSLHSPKARKFRALRKCLSELQELYAEANTILNELLISPSAAVIRSLCARFRILQEYFAMRYLEAKALAFSALGRIDSIMSLP